MKKLLGITLAIAILGVATIKDINTTQFGTMVTFRDNTGYWIEKGEN